MKTKNMRKLASLLLALVLALSLSVSAFAAIPPSGSINVTVEFYDGNDFLMDWPTEMTSANATTSYDLPELGANESLDPRIILDANRPTVMDATIFALDEIGTPVELFWDRQMIDDTHVEYTGGYLDEIFGYKNIATDYLKPTETTDGYWEGNAWLYKVVDANGIVVVEPGLNFDGGVYATNVVLEEGMTITWTYTYNIHTPIPARG